MRRISVTDWSSRLYLRITCNSKYAGSARVTTINRPERLRSKRSGTSEPSSIQSVAMVSSASDQSFCRSCIVKACLTLTCDCSARTSHKTTRKSSPSRTMTKLIVPFLIQFLLTYAQGQGQGPPVDDERVQFEIDEEQPVGTPVGTINTRPGLTYRLSSPSEEFHLEPDTGQITTKVVIDREALSSDTLNLLVQSVPSANHLIEVLITVLDVNDNSPIFSEPSILVSFSEADQPGRQIVLDTAMDRDKGVNDITDNYTIVSGNEEGKFRLILLTDTSRPLLYLENLVQLDREEQDSYQLNISAQDGASPPRYGFLQVNISVSDVNDKPPLFDQSDYTAEVNETAPPDTSIIQVHASDQDIGANAEITYSIVSDDHYQFAIDPRTGIVTTLKKLTCYRSCDPSNVDCEPNSCVITIEARDSGGPIPLIGRAFLTVIVRDENNHWPSISFLYTGSTPYATVEEGAEEGKTVVALVSVTDKDEGLNGRTFTMIVSGNELGHFILEASSSNGFNILKVNGKLDRERMSKYNLTFEARDMGAPQRKSRASLIIIVNDINDHAPVFQYRSYSAYLPELVPVGSFVASISATDNDTGINSAITYDIVSGNQLGWFSIDQTTGLVTTTQVLDRENQSMVILAIRARDGAAQPQTSSTNLTITILDENDQTPSFNADVFDLAFSEGTRAGAATFTLTATDSDFGSNGTVRYFLDRQAEQDYPDIFQLNQVTGRLTFLKDLDREEYSDYSFLVWAIDQGTPQLSSSATVHITINDINDNKPIFYPAKYYVVVEEIVPLNTRLVQVSATDLDVGQNARITYHFEGSYSSFRIDSLTGWIISTAPLERGTGSLPASHTLAVSATDGGNQTSETTAEVLISVINTRDDIPSFSSMNGYDFSIQEDNSLDSPRTGRSVGQVGLSGGSQSSIKYSIIDGDPENVFTINQNTGSITTSKPIDRESQDFYSLAVVAAKGSLYVHTVVNISVTDVNDNVPAFGSADVDAVVIENWPVGHDIHLASAYDPDSGENGRVMYNLTSDSSSFFRIIPETGMIVLARPLGQILSYSFVVYVSARDSGSPSWSSQQQVRISVLDVNDHTPTFDQTSYEVSVSESQPINDQFFNVTAIDEDVGMNSYVTYEIVKGNREGKFGIFPNGVLYIARLLDRESSDLYVLTIKASDHGEPPRFSMTNVTIYVLDANDNNPVFSNRTYNFVMAENKPEGSSVGTVYASDRDKGQNAELSFHIEGDSSGFFVHSLSGLIVTSKMFDREQVVRNSAGETISFNVVVEDNGEEQRTDTAAVNVLITDVNDNTPVFNQPLYNVNLHESVGLQSSVVTVIASDDDKGRNARLVYSLISDPGYFVIDSITGLITVNKSLDRELKDRHEISVMVMDEGDPPLNSTAQVVVTVLDDNDNAPEFVLYQDEVSIMENTEVGRDITKVMAVDRDLGSSSIVTYSITAGNVGNVFRIDGNTGMVILAQPLNYESQNIYFLNITAEDLGSPILSSSVITRIFVLDFNDNAPVFPSGPLVDSVVEGASEDTLVTTVTATDADSSRNGQIVYSIKKQDPPGRHFAIDGTSGRITTVGELDHEFANSYSLTVVATDQARPISDRLNSEKVVTVLVTDINDNAPEFVSVNAVPVLQGTQTGNVITTVSAVDPDGGDNGKVSYEIYSGDTQTFGINDASTGDVFLRAALNNQVLTYQLTIRAEDHGRERKNSFFQLTIFIQSSTDNGPQFSQSSYSGQVYENEFAGTSIVTVSASYPSNPGGSANIEYHITSITADGRPTPRYFQVNPTSGLISTAAVLDRESGYHVFDVVVYAVDKSASSPRTRSKQVQITLLDRNDCPPYFSSDLYELSVSEDSTSGHVVDTVVATDDDDTGSITYSIRDGADKKFDIDPTKGEITVIGDLDRETKSTYTLHVVASDGIQETETTVTMEITDVNDQPPVFNKDSYSFDVDEDARTGMRLGQIRATDADEGINADLSYSIMSYWGRDKFSLHPRTGFITLVGNLDYEQNNHFILTVKVHDSGTIPLSSTATVYINVIDVNDNAPIYDPSTYSDLVFENTTVGTDILSVSATDIDAGKNGEVTYSITGGDPQHQFDVYPETGVIFVAKPLDRETQAHYNLDVQAIDQAEDPRDRLSSTAVVTVVLKDTNDNPPVFNSPSVITVMENTAVSASVYQISASDLDKDENGEVTFSLEQGSGDVFSIGSSDGVLRVNQILDRESQNEYSISVLATDLGTPALTSTMTFSVKVGDANDNDPVLNPNTYSATVLENVRIGTKLLDVYASDLDLGPNAEIRFLVVEGDSNQDFYLNSHSGEFSVQKRLDYERKKVYNIKILAQDLGDTPRSDTATIQVTVEDVNDCAPLFVDSPYIAYVQENAAELPVHVTRLTARDDDSGAYGRVSYSILEGDRSLFNINSSSGEITLLRSLDREQVSRYELKVTGFDTGSPRLTGVGTVTVLVGDVNDNLPVFYHAAYEAQVMENLPAPAPVVRVQAYDDDVGKNADIRYSLVRDLQDSFTIDEFTGQITTKTSLDRETTPVHHLVVMATDSASIPFSSTATVVVRVGDDNDNAPRFIKQNYDVQIRNPTQSAAFVLGVSALDVDVLRNGQIEYSLFGGSHVDKFTINSITGVITAAETLSGSQQYQFFVRATDMGDIQLSDEAKITISFLPSLTSGFPDFTSTQRSSRVPESAPVGYPVASFSASSQRQGSISYYIAGGSVEQAFSINDQGQIKVKSSLDYEVTQNYQLWIEARDTSATPYLSEYTDLNVEVIDDNDNVPVFDQYFYNVSVPEEEFPLRDVITLHATDDDSERNGVVRYNIDAGNVGGAFQIDDISGLIQTRIKLDREAVESYELTVFATDRGSQRNTATATVRIVVEDKNDRPPIFSQHFNIRIPESAPVGSFVLRITSTDEDIGDNAKHTYSFIKNPGGKFAIDQNSGNITVAERLDREMIDEYILEVAANDGAYNAETSVSIDILDVNDNRPSFDQAKYEFTIVEDLASGTNVGVVTASDLDAAGPNADLFYRLKNPTRFFSIHPTTGEIVTREILTYKFTGTVPSPENTQQLTVIACDQGEPPLSSEVPVVIQILAENVHSPVFEQDKYVSAIVVNSPFNVTVTQLNASDDDFGINGDIIYEVIGGNGSQMFTVDPVTGVVYLASTVDSRQVGLKYQVLIRASDKGTPSRHNDTSLMVYISEINYNSPQFQGSEADFQVTVLESHRVGETIARVTATDDDSGINSEITYSIVSGDPVGVFFVNPLNGSITTEVSLDYETQSIYRLAIKATDGGVVPQSQTRVLTVTITDVNDNPPLFTQNTFDVTVRENIPLNSTVFDLQASDIDSDPYNVIKYRKMSTQSPFSINTDTGVIISTGILDYETENEYSLSVEAYNPGSTLTSTALVLVHIEGVNEYVPRFAETEYSFTVSESDSIGYAMGAVSASDLDTGPDGQVFYYFIGDSNMKGFSIDTETGIISIAESIDREATSEITLDVLAKNQGPISGNDTDKCRVRVIVRDANDPPQFTRSLYEGPVREDANVGYSVLKVSAVDNDLQTEYRTFYYSIAAGNVGEAFAVNRNTGWITTNSDLDRERIGIYNLTLAATDTGTPPKTGTVLVKVYVNDVNDNGPHFIPDIPNGQIMENQTPYSSVIIDLTHFTQDRDLDPNRGPFRYYLLSHTDKFDIGATSGIVKAKKVLDRETVSRYNVKVRVDDNGASIMTSNLTFRIDVQDENDNPSTARDLQVEAFVYEGRYPGGLLANVRPNDPDVTGNYSCRIVTSDGSAFSIPRSCELHASQLQNLGSFEISLQGSDGVHGSVSYTTSVELQRFDSDTVANSLVLKVANITAEEFVGSKYSSFVQVIQENLDEATSERLVLFAVNNAPPSIDVFIAVTIRETNYLSKNLLKEKLLSIKDRIQQRAGLVIVSVDSNSCVQSPCQNGGQCSSSVQILNGQRNIIDSPTRVLTTAPKVSLEVVCDCEQGYTGPFCEEHVNACKSQPCLNGGSCTSTGAGLYSCECPSAFTGKRCQRDVDECEVSQPCQNGGVCENTEGSYTCNCPDDFAGTNCEIGTNNCGNSGPCLNGGQCVDGACQCRYGDRGTLCEVTSRNFQPLSFLEYNLPMNQMTNSIEVEFATVSDTALLVYFYGDSAATDYMALEIISGRVRFTFSAGDEVPGRVMVPVDVSDGGWYRVQAERTGTLGVLRVSSCPANSGVCSVCQDGDTTCYRRGQQNSNRNLLDNDSQHVVLVGGLRGVADITQHLSSSQPTITTHDFIGCMRSLRVENMDIWPGVTSSRQQGVSAGCSRQPGGVGVECPVCENGGLCEESWSSAKCQCTAKYIGKTCSQRVESFSFGPNSVVIFTQKETYVRDKLAESQLTRRKKRNTQTDVRSLLIEMRTVNKQGLLFLEQSPNSLSALYINDGYINYYSQDDGNTVSVTVTEKVANDGHWHNISVVISDDGGKVTLSLDDVVTETRKPFTIASLVSIETQVFYVGGSSSPATINGTVIAGFEGCVKRVDLGGADLPLSGDTDRFTIESRGSTNSSCSPSFHGPVIVPDDDSPPVHIAVIVVVAVFGVAILVMVLVFLVLRMRRRQQEKQNATKQNGNAKASGAVLKDGQAGVGGEGGQVSEEEFNIHQHIQDELTTSNSMYHQRVLSPPLVGSRPDLVTADTNHTRESLSADSNGVENQGFNDEPPEHYDIDNASSIAPSDLVDVVSHYKNYRRGMLGNNKHKHGHRHGMNQSPSNMLAPTRESPGLHITRHSPASLTNHRNSPNPHTFLAQNPLIRQSPHTVNNLNLPGPSRNMTKSPLANIAIRDATTPVPPSMRSTPLSGVNGLYSPSNASSTPSSYEYPPLSNGHVPSRPGSHLRQPISTLGIRSTPTVGLTVEEVNRLNARHKSSPISTVDAVSSSSSSTSSTEQPINNKINTTDFTHADLLDPVSRIHPESSSEDDTNDDSFTCSEYEFDNDKARQDFTNPHRLVPPPARSGRESGDGHLRSSSHDAASDSTRGDQDSFSTFFTSDDDTPSGRLPTSALNWDYLLNWGPNFEKLVGVFNDIAMLPDSGGVKDSSAAVAQTESVGHTRQDSGGKSPRPPSASRTSPHLKSHSPKPQHPKVNSHRSFATPSPLHVIEEDLPYRENGIDAGSLSKSVKEEYV